MPDFNDFVDLSAIERERDLPDDEPYPIHHDRGAAPENARSDESEEDEDADVT